VATSCATISQHLMEPEGSLPHSQEPSTCLYPEPDILAFVTHSSSRHIREINRVPTCRLLPCPSHIHFSDTSHVSLSAAHHFVSLSASLHFVSWSVCCSSLCVSAAHHFVSLLLITSCLCLLLFTSCLGLSASHHFVSLSVAHHFVSLSASLHFVSWSVCF
jgi:hypothetical protein